MEAVMRIRRNVLAPGVLTIGAIGSLAAGVGVALLNQRMVVRAASRDRVYVTRRYVIRQSPESATVIGMRDCDCLVESPDRCKPGGWADLWLAVAGVAAALGVSALVGALTLSSTGPGTLDALWVLMAAGGAIFCLCMIGYLAQRRRCS